MRHRFPAAGRQVGTATSANHTDIGAPNSNRTFCKDFMQLSCPQPYNAGRMAQREDPRKTTDEAQPTPDGRQKCAPTSDSMICERCGKAEMYRMHAVWRCPECGFKTDCCGW